MLDNSGFTPEMSVDAAMRIIRERGIATECGEDSVG